MAANLAVGYGDVYVGATVVASIAAGAIACICIITIVHIAGGGCLIGAGVHINVVGVATMAATAPTWSSCLYCKAVRCKRHRITL